MKQILYIGNQLQARGGTPTSIDVLAPLLREEGFQVKTASANPGKLQRLKEMLLLVIRNRKATNYVLIDTYSTQNFWYAVFVASLCRRLGLPYIPILHGGDLPARVKRSPEVSKKLFANAFTNVAPSTYLLSRFKNMGFRNLQYIPNVIRLESYPFIRRPQLKPRLLWVRSFSEVYNPLLALQVLEILLLKYRDAELCMVGPEKDETLKACRRMAEEKELPVKFFGRMSKEHWVQLAAEYDIFLNTTNVDNTPVSVIEAMALGLPVVSTEVGGMPFLLEDKETGLLVPPGNAIKMAEAVEYLLQHPERGTVIAAAAREKVQFYDWRLVKEQWKALLSANLL